MNLEKIISFKAVAEEGSISKAAARVHLSQPALSLQIQALEHELGLKLFERHNRGLILTEEGEVLKGRAAMLEEWIKETEAELHKLRSCEGKIRIGTYTTASSYLLSPRIGKFLSTYPRIEISYQYYPTDETLRRIKAMDLDCAVISEVPETEGIKVEPFFNDELILVCSGKNRIIPTDLSKEELGNFPFLSYPLRQDYCYQEVERRFGKYLKKAHVPVESESFDTLKQSLLHDLGIGFMPEYLVKKELEKKKLRKINLKVQKLPITFSFVTKEGRKLSPKLEAFKTFLKTSF